MAKDVLALDPIIKKLLGELGRAQTAKKEYESRPDLIANADRYIGQLIENSKGSIALDPGMDYTSHYTPTGLPAGNYNANTPGQILNQNAQKSQFIDQSGQAKQGAFDIKPIMPTTAPVTQTGQNPAHAAAPVTNPLPTSNPVTRVTPAPAPAATLDPLVRGAIPQQTQGEAPPRVSGGGVAYSPAPAPVTVAPIKKPEVFPDVPVVDLATMAPSASPAGQVATNYQQPATTDWNAIRGRAKNDAGLQVNNLRDQANRNYNRFASEGQSQIDALLSLYAPAYQDNELATTAAARNAVQGAANRGFFSSGISANADLQAKLAGERERMRLKGQETAQVGEIKNRMNLSQRELGDTLQSLTDREGQLTQSLVDMYGKDERSFDLQNRSLSSDIALKLLGMDQSYDQFNQSLAWDKDKFGQQLGDQGTQRKWQSGENALNRNLQTNLQGGQQAWQTGENQAQRDWSGMQNADQRGWQSDEAIAQRSWDSRQNELGRKAQADLQAAEQTWRSGQAQLDRIDAQTRAGIENGLREKWHQEETMYKYTVRSDERQAVTAAGMSSIMNGLNEYRKYTAAGKEAPIEVKHWGSYDSAVRYFDSRSSMLAAEGADINSIFEFLKQQYGMSDGKDPFIGPRL